MQVKQELQALSATHASITTHLQVNKDKHSTQLQPTKSKNILLYPIDL